MKRFKAKSLSQIMEKTIKTKYKFGTTGTLDGTLTHKLVLEGLFGKTYTVTSTKELIDNKTLSPFQIKCTAPIKFQIHMIYNLFHCNRYM